MTLKEQLLQMINALPEEESTAAEVSEVGEAETVPDTNAPAAEVKQEPSTVEDTEVVAPAVDNDITIITSEDMVGESIDMRLASFYSKQQELEDTVKILLSEVQTLKAHFTTIETAIDTAAETSPTVESIENLINQL